MGQNIDAYDLDLGEIRRRTYRAVTQDGLLELLMGVGFAAAAVFVALDVFLDVPLFFLIGIPASLLPFLMNPLRQRYTHVRVGYVELVTDEGRRLMRAILVAAMLLGVLALIVTLVALVLQQPFVMIAALFENLAVIVGLFLGAIFLYMAARYGITRYYTFGLLSILSGFIAQMVDITALSPEGDPVAHWMLYFAVMAIILLPGGVIMFARFLRDNPVLAEGADDGQA